MQIINWTDFQNKNITFNNLKTGVSVGSFDGLHAGHRQLLNKLLSFCKMNNCKSVVVSFVRPLPSLKHSQDYQGDVSTLSQRIKLFEAFGIDYLLLVDFNQEFASLKGNEFFDILKNKLNMIYIAEGVDFRCGYKGATDTTAIRYWAEKNHVTVDLLPQVFFKEGEEIEERISSSTIRNMIKKGYFSTVETLLSRKYELQLDSSMNIQIKKNCIAIPLSCFNQVLPVPGNYMVTAICGENTEFSEVRVTDSDLILNLNKLPECIRF